MSEVMVSFFTRILLTSHFPITMEGYQIRAQSWSDWVPIWTNRDFSDHFAIADPEFVSVGANLTYFRPV